jgi:hypothetical protein
MTTDLVKSISIANLLSQRDAMLERLRQVNALLIETEEIGTRAGIVDADAYRSLQGMVGTQGVRHSHELPLLDPQDIDGARKRIDSAAWDLLMRESGLMSFMDSNAREEWRQKIEKADTPALTRENIETTFESLYLARGDMFERGVIRCFKRLAWCYKTNLPQMFGRRIVIRIRSYGHVDYALCDPLEDLQRVMATLDGKPQDDHRHGLHNRLRDAEGSYGTRNGQFQHVDQYMSFRVFKNGNAHITFTRPDLVEQLNKILAKHYPNALPAPKE